MPRRFPIVQLPNAPLLAAVAAWAVARATDGETARGAGLMSQAALLVWAYEEITDGANWFRRLLGAGAGAAALAELARLGPGWSLSR